MSWANELYKVYESVVGTEVAGGETPLLPVSHSTANAQIEITIKEDGDFVSANALSKENAETIIPVTEDSGTRSSGIAPMPLADKLVYIAGDYPMYTEGKRSDNSEFFSAYMEQLENWCESDHSHFAVKAIYTYIAKKQLMTDLIKSGILTVDEDTGKLQENVKIANISQEDSFVRFIVESKDGLCRTWLDESVYDSFIQYNSCRSDKKDLCYATGEREIVTYKHPSKVRNSGDKAKLISANDESGFTYRGRFTDKEQAISVSYEFSQKMHNALKWLISRQGRSFDTLTLVTWQSSLAELPPVTKSVFDFDDEDEQPEYDPKRYFAERLTKLMLGYKEGFNEGDKVMVMGLDAATTGRLSVAIYTELDGSDFLDNLKKWHEQTAWLRFNTKKNRREVNSFGFYDIANCAFGTEQSGKPECDKKLLRDTVLRLLPCTVEGKRLPVDIVRALYNKASQPLAFEYKTNHSKTVEVACGMIRKAQLDSGNKKYYKGEITMAYDPECTDRSYLFGCLLAIADKAESDTYEKGKDDKRVTNARRYWSAFSSRPYQTWQLIEEKLQPYLEKDKRIMVRYTRHLNEIMGKMSTDDFKDNSKLSPMYLIGFHHYNALLWAGKNDTNEENEEE